MSAKGGSWAAYRANWAVSRVGLAIMFVYVTADKIPHLVPDNLREAYHNWINAHAILGGVLLLGSLAISIIATLNVINLKCPRCGEFFSYPLPTRDDCQNCGLGKYADPDAAAASGQS